MTAAILNAGWTPYVLRVVLNPHGVYRAQYQRQSGPFDPSTVVQYVFATGDIWTAGITGDLATFTKTATEVDALIAAIAGDDALNDVRLTYSTDAGGPYAWAVGDVWVTR